VCVLRSVVRGDARPLSLSPCNTYIYRKGTKKTKRTGQACTCVTNQHTNNYRCHVPSFLISAQGTSPKQSNPQTTHTLRSNDKASIIAQPRQTAHSQVSTSVTQSALHSLPPLSPPPPPAGSAQRPQPGNR